MNFKISQSSNNELWPVDKAISFETNIADNSQLIVWCNGGKTVFNDYKVVFSEIMSYQNITICGYVFNGLGLSCNFETIQIAVLSLN